MHEQLTPKILRTTDESRLETGGDVRQVTRVVYQLGKFGPFEKEFPRDGFNQYALQQEFEEKARTLEPFLR